jgi:pectate lyase
MGRRWTTLLTRLRAAIVGGMAAALSLAASDALAQNKAFPQAEGAGAEATGGRGGYVYHVTSLGDSNTPGTLRYGLTSFLPNSPITIVFDVGGWINLNDNLGITRNNVTIAGQTAPGGIGLKNRKFSIGGDDIIVRHMHFAYGVTAADRNDTINVNENSSDVVFDHISAGLSRDETFSVRSMELTLQWSSVSYGLEDHSAGSLIEQAHELSFHHNIYAHNHTRNPKARVNDTIDWINNLVYDYDIGFIAGDSDTTDYFWTANFDGNYFITGPGDVGNRMITDGRSWNYGLYFGTNAYDGDGDAVHDGVEYDLQSRDLSTVVGGSYTWSTNPYPVADPIWKDADPQAAYERVLAEFGPTPWARNDFDALIASNIVNRQGNLISNQSQLASLGIGNGGFGTIVGGAAPTDADQDGMPDDWELKHGLLPNRPSNNGDFDNDGFTDLEEYLNEIAAFKATGPIEFVGNNRYAESENWTRRWEPSQFDEVHIDFDTANVDAVGQHAGLLTVGNRPGGIATLNITNGWLEVADELVIGVDAAATATLNLSGGALRTPELSKGVGGAFNFTGGTLQADVVNFDLENQGGLISPGQSIGQTHVAGDLTLTAGAVRIELASPTSSDRIVVDGHVTLGGALSVAFLDGYLPESGNWEIMTADSFTGAFDLLPVGYSVQQQGNSLLLVVGAAPVLAGDYNDDGTVDAADYTVWRDRLASGMPLVNETASLGVVDAADYDAWKANFGATGGSGSAGQTNSAVPEPASWILGLLTLVGSGMRLRRAQLVR